MEFGRLRRNKRNQQMRDLLSETRVSVNDLIIPYFVVDGMNKREPIKSMPLIERLSVDNLIEDLEGIRDLGIKAVLIFGVCDKKDQRGLSLIQEQGLLRKQ